MLKHFANLVYFEQIFHLLFSVGKKKKLDWFFFFATIFRTEKLKQKEIYMKRGFTLIELLVVVLIIGILSAVALPQYTRSVEKARLSEALQNIKVFMDAANLYLMENGGTSAPYGCFKDFSAVDLSGGEWNADADCEYETKNFIYGSLYCAGGDCGPEIRRQNGDYTLAPFHRNGWTKTCYTEMTEMGRFICKSLESQGWEYSDNPL